MPATTPQVSVIIPTYNRKHLVQPAIESVLKQTYQDYELIVVDDASTDGTAEWIATTYPTIQLVRLPINRGAAGARNEGIRLATGNLIAFLDSDDQWTPNYLEVQVKTLQENKNAVLSYCNYLEIKEDGSQCVHNLKPWSIFSNFTHHLLIENVIHTMSLVMVRREALLQAGSLNETLKICHDRELYLRVLYFGKIVHVPQNLVFKITHTTNLIGNYRRWAKEVIMVLDIFFADERSQPYKHLYSEAKSRCSLKMAKLVWQSHHDVLFTSQMIGQAVLSAPMLISQSFWRRVTKVIS